MTTIKNKRRTVLPKRPFSSALTSFVVAGFSSAALGNPQNLSVVAGSATANTAGSELTVETTGRTILNWGSFSIGNGELTRFVMSGADQAVLNRVTGGALSVIAGTLEANGRLYLINPNGVIVSGTGVVQTQSFIASTRDIMDEDFMDGGELSLFGTGSGEVHHLGTIEATDGDVALIGNRVVSSGSIAAPRGVIALAAGDDVMLAVPGSERLLVRVNRVGENSAPLVDHTGILNAAQAELYAAGGNPFALAVNAGGQINATGIQNRAGRIYLSTDVAQIDVPGTLTARNSDGTGGAINIYSGVGYGSEIEVDGTLDVTSTTWGGIIDLDGSRISLNDGSRLVTSADLTAGAVTVGSIGSTDYLYVAPGAVFEANSSTGEAGLVDLGGAGVYFYGQFSGRGAVRPGQLTIRTGEALEYAGLADLRSWNDQTRFGLVDIASTYSHLDIALSGSAIAVLIDAESLATQLNYSNVLIATWGADRTVGLHTPLSWESATRLSLQAGGNLDIDQAISAANGSLQLSSLSGNVTAPASIAVRDLWLSAQDEVNLSGRVVAQNVTLYDVGARTLLTNEQNELGNVTFTRDLRAQSGEVDIVDSAGGLTLTTNNVGGITYSTDGNFRVRTSGDLTLSSAFQAQVDGDVTLVAAGSVLRNQSTAGANVFGTSSTGLGRTRVYGTGVGENGGLVGPAQYNVSYSLNHEAAANTGFYYSGNAPQEPNPPDPVDPTPETPALPPSQIIQTALDGNSFEQLNRPPQNDPSRFTPINLPVPQPPADLNGWTTGTVNQLETLAQLAGIEGNTKQLDNASGEQQQQPQQQVVDQMEDAVARVMALLQEMQTSGGALTSEQLAQGLGSMPPELNQLLTQSPAVFQQQLALVLTQFSMGQQNEALAGRTQAANQQIEQIRLAAEQMRNTAAEQLVNAISQMVNAALTLTSDKSPQKLPQPTAPRLPTEVVKNVPPSTPSTPSNPFPGGKFQVETGTPPPIPTYRPPSLPQAAPIPPRPTPTLATPQPDPIIVPVPSPIPPVVRTLPDAKGGQK